MSTDDLATSQPEASADSVNTNLRIRLDRGHPRMARTEESLRSLRERIERQLDQEDHLRHMYQGWQQSWSDQCDQLQQQAARLEAYLTAWYPREVSGHRLSVVDAE